jgi:hypothetical protein
MALLSQVNLPIIILLHSIFLSFTGLRMIFRSSIKPNREAEASAMAGFTTLAIGLAYLTTSYMPISENQFLHASVPVRILLALVAAVRLVIVRNVSKDGQNEMLFVTLYDGIGGLICGWQLGNFSGRLPGL